MSATPERARKPRFDFAAAIAKAYLALILIFLYVPILVMAVLAFNRSPLYQLPFEFDLRWFKDLAANDRLLAAGRNSVVIALANTVLATFLGTAAALAFSRYTFRGRGLMQLLLLPPITIPWLVIGTAMLVFFYWTFPALGLPPRGLHSILLGHVALSLPYVIIVVGARLADFPKSVEEAAATLGATPWQTFWRVSAPIIAPGVVAAALFAFATSFDQFVISYFLAPPGVTTLPVEIYTSIRKGFTPEINAISTIIIAVSMGIMLITARFYKFGGER
ncbi:MAG TPA: ABC transporter permease [Candidatus Cybelea sp.]|nr:ABC transporter permease [Candidatus Cybelea sp.]